MDIKKKVPQPEQVEAAVPTKKLKRSSVSLKKFRLIIVLAVVLVLLSGFLTYKYIQINRQIKQLQNGSNQVVATSTQKLLTKVGNLALLPQGQTPSVAIVKNVDQLKSQAFFDSAQNGDYLIVYTQAKKAILYRPSDNRIVEYANTN
jgi:hypothetical protein